MWKFKNLIGLPKTWRKKTTFATPVPDASFRWAPKTSDVDNARTIANKQLRRIADAMLTLSDYAALTEWRTI